MPDDYTIYAEDGRKLWDLGDFQFLRESAVPNTVNPSLWMNGKCNLQAGVFEVLPGKIYQVRGIDVANITFVRSKTGWIVLDVTTCVESSREGIRLLEKALGEPVWDKIRAVIIRPTNHISEDTTITIDGLKVDFQITPGTEAPAEMNNYFPEYRAFWAAENCTGTLHNLYPIRGAQVRDSANWWKFTEVALEKYGDYTGVVFQSHNWPHENTEENPNMVKDFLKNSAAIYKFVHDQTLLYANHGKTSSEIAIRVKYLEKCIFSWGKRFA